MLKMRWRWISQVHIDDLFRQASVTGMLTSRGPTSAWSRRCRRKTQECGCCHRCRCQCRAESLLLRWEPPPLQMTLRWSSGGCGDWRSDHRWGFHSHSWGWNNQRKNIFKNTHKYYHTITIYITYVYWYCWQIRRCIKLNYCDRWVNVRLR